MPKIDLHTHSTASDGSLTPTQLIISAKEQGVDRLALTDHDTVAGLREAIAAGQKYGVRVIKGIELSVNYEAGELHLLGYGFDDLNIKFTATVAKLQISRAERNHKIVSKLNEQGYSISWDTIHDIAGGGVIGRGHIGQALMNAGYFDSIQTVFEQLLSTGAPAYVDRFRLELREAIRLIHNAGGIAVWAHPGLHGDELEVMLDDLLPHWADAGLDGLESDYNLHSIELRDRLRAVADSHGMIYTGGSDFHGQLKPDVSLGQGPEGMAVSEECYQGLTDRIKGVRS